MEVDRLAVFEERPEVLYIPGRQRLSELSHGVQVILRDEVLLLIIDRLEELDKAAFLPGEELELDLRTRGHSIRL